jgi:eukaryotic-like serine/threonine-protein kinase
MSTEDGADKPDTAAPDSTIDAPLDGEATVIVPASEQKRYFASLAGGGSFPGASTEPGAPGKAQAPTNTPNPSQAQAKPKEGSTDEPPTVPGLPAASLAPAPATATEPTTSPSASPSISSTSVFSRTQPSGTLPGGTLPGGTLPGSTLPTGTPLSATGPEPHSSTLPGQAPHHGELTTRIVGRYEVRDRLGRGGMATVYRAHDPDISRDVALKFLHASLCADEDCRDRFLREARAAGGLSHPNIVIVHDVGQIEGRPYMAMELLDGASLADVLADGKPLPIRDTVVMGIQLARALDYAHTRGIVHRDIKPGNIVRLKDSTTIKVTDFGIAHMESGNGEQHTRSGEVIGTPQYMSPEQTLGDKIDGRSDLFSTGVVLYQMLSGQRPFQGDSMVAVALKIAKDQPTPIEKLCPDIPANLRRVVERCLAKNPAQRYQSGKELADELIKILADIDEAALDKNRPRIIPLRVKWALTMGLVVAIVMGITATITTKRQYAAMMSQVSDYGAALSRFIAAQNAVAVLSDDWGAVDVSLQEIMKTRDFDSVTVVDRGGVVRAASNTALVGANYQPPKGEPLPARPDKIKAWRYASLAGKPVAPGETVLGFEAPITFAGKHIGSVLLSLPEQPLTQVATLSMSLMAILVVVTVLAVAIAMYFVANWFARPIKQMTEALEQVGKGRFDYRINEPRKDEFGLLYQSFDQMAQALQDRASGATEVRDGTAKS